MKIKINNLKEIFGDKVVEVKYIHCKSKMQNKANPAPSNYLDGVKIAVIGSIIFEDDEYIELDRTKSPQWIPSLLESDNTVKVPKNEITKITIYEEKSNSDPLRFLGRGSCFNVKEGNTSAFFETATAVYLIDCGETVFHKIMDLKETGKHDIFKQHKAFNILITHLHSDHVGSLPSVLFYCKYVLDKKPTIYYPNKEQLIAYLTLSGVPSDAYNINSNRVTIDTYASIEFVNEDHYVTNSAYDDYKEEKICEQIIDMSRFTQSFGLVITLGGNNKSTKIYYSSDTMTPLYSNESKARLYDYYYYDAAIREVNAEGNKYPHCNLNELIVTFIKNYIPLDRLRLIHIDEDAVFEMANMFGIKCVEIE